MVCDIRDVVLHPDDRKVHIDRLSRAEGLTNDHVNGLIEKYKALLVKGGQEAGSTLQFLNDIQTRLRDIGFVEGADCCYSGLALTGLEGDEKKRVLDDHFLIKAAIKAAGYKNYDPAEAPFNPQEQLVGQPTEVSDVDTLMVVASRLFTFTNLAPSSGGGMELRSANLYNKLPFNIVKRGVYVSRMTTGARRVLTVEYTDLSEQGQALTDLIGTIGKCDLGVGTCSEHGNTILGFGDGSPTCLVGMMERDFPHLCYDFYQYLK